MTRPDTLRLLEPAPNVRSREIALFLAQMDDQSRRLLLDVEASTPDDLAWQPRPGTNTIGMLLAHIAIVEVYWIAIMAQTDDRMQETLGIGMDDDGMPIAADGLPPANLSGKDLAYYRDLLDRARTNTKRTVAEWEDARLAERIVRRRRDGQGQDTVEGRWVLYHILEHEAGHYGQILLLRHLLRASREAATPGAVGAARA